MIKLKSILKEAKEGTKFFYPTTKKYGMGKQQHLQIFQMRAKDEAFSISGNGMLSLAWDDKVAGWIKKYGQPSAKEVKANIAIDKLFWKTNKVFGRTGYKLAGWKKFGNGSTSDLAYVYSGKGLYEIYLNLPRAYRHQDEQNLSDEYIKFFDTVESEVSKIESKIKGMGFKVEISASPTGYRG